MNGNSKITISDIVIRRLYYRYQSFVTPLVTILVCLLLFWFVVLGQIQNWFALRDTIAVNAQDLLTMHQNLDLINKLNDVQLESTLTTATTALPTEKDFTGIINSLQTAASIAGTSLSDYTFQLGDLTGLDQQGKLSQLPIQLNVVLKGGVIEAEHFIHQLKNQLPLADATAVVVNQNASVTVTVIFYYAQLPKINFVNTNPLPVLSSGDQQLISSLVAISSLSNVQLATPAAVPTPTVQVTTPTPLPTFAPTPISTSSATTSAR